MPRLWEQKGLCTQAGSGACLCCLVLEKSLRSAVGPSSSKLTSRLLFILPFAVIVLTAFHTLEQKREVNI